MESLSTGRRSKPLQALVVDDSATIRFAMARMLRELGIEVTQAGNGPEALARFQQGRPDLVLIDVNMPGMSGFSVVREMRVLSGDQWIPIIFLSSMEGDESIVRGIECGGDDYLVKPVSQVVLGAKIRALRRLEGMRHELAHVSAELTLANERLAILSQEDGLTGLANRRKFDQQLQQEVGRARRGHHPISLLLCDVDFFKAFNDAYGHPAGDACLQKVALALQAACKRPADLAARYGGEEFAIILPETPAEGARCIAQAAIEAIAQQRIAHRASRAAPHVTISIGICTLVAERDTSIESLVKCADVALYRAKTQGRNRCVAFDDEVAQAAPAGLVA